MNIFSVTFHTRRLSLLFVFATLLIFANIASGQTVSTWSGGAGNWSDCPPSGNALWNTCPDPPQGLGWPNGNFDAVINGGPVTATSASVVNLSIGTAGILLFAPNLAVILQIMGTSMVNNGSITLAGSDGLQLITSGTVTLSGSGSVTMAGNRFTASGNPTLILQEPLQGFGTFTNGMALNNQSTINASGGTLEMQATAVTNTGTIEASSGGILQFSPGGPISFNNTGGTIEALNGGTVQLYGSTYTGGTLTTTGTGVIQATGDAILNNLTNSGTVQVSTTAVLEGTITNTGTLEIPAGSLDVDGATTVTGSGSIILSGSGRLAQFTGSDSLTNEQVIHGAGTIYQVPLSNKGTINADSKSNFLYLEGATTTNASILEASAGGTLQLDTVVNNSGGTIEALTGSTVIFTSNFNGSINGGTLTTSGTGVIESQNGVLDGTLNVPTNAGKLNVDNFNLSIQGTINNTGTISLSGNACIELNEPSTLEGSGKVVMASNTCIYGSGIAFTNASTIEGAGSIGDSNPMPITNTGTILANSSSPLLIRPNSSGFTNTGKLTVNSGSTLTVDSPFNSLSGTGTLATGTYSVAGTLGLPGAIVSNAANVTLTGASAEILNTSASTNALAAVTSNATTGTLSLQSGQSLATTTALANAGKITVGTTSSLKVGGKYLQTAGTTIVDGTLTVPSGITLQKGSLLGKGTIAAAVTSSGATVTAGDSSTKPGTLSITGSYTQQSRGVLDIYIGGTTAGTFGELVISNGASLGGILTIKLANGIVPVVGDSFTILSGSAVSGTFATVNGESINSSEHFQVNYTSTAVTLTVVSGP